MATSARLEAGGATSDPQEAALAYAAAGADEILLASRGTPVDVIIALVEDIAPSLSIPLMLDADLHASSEVERVIAAGAGRVCVQRAALADPDYIATLCREFGSGAVAVRVAARREEGVWRVLEAPGGEATEWDAVTWAAVAEAQGAGTIIVEPAGPAGPGEPFDLELLEALTSALRTPVLAAGPAENVEDLFDALMIGNADGVLVEDVLHSGRTSVRRVKGYLAERGLPVR